MNKKHPERHQGKEEERILGSPKGLPMCHESSMDLQLGHDHKNMQLRTKPLHWEKYDLKNRMEGSCLGKPARNSRT